LALAQSIDQTRQRTEIRAVIAPTRLLPLMCAAFPRTRFCIERFPSLLYTLVENLPVPAAFVIRPNEALSFRAFDRCPISFFVLTFNFSGLFPFPLFGNSTPSAGNHRCIPPFPGLYFFAPVQFSFRGVFFVLDDFPIPRRGLVLSLLWRLRNVLRKELLSAAPSCCFDQIPPLSVRSIPLKLPLTWSQRQSSVIFNKALPRPTPFPPAATHC